MRAVRAQGTYQSFIKALYDLVNRANLPPFESHLFYYDHFFQGTKIRLLPEVITASDPDTLPENLQFTILPMDSKGMDSNQGILEFGKEPGKSIQSFTQADLENRNVWYEFMFH